MHQKNQETEPSLSIVEQKKQEAGRFVAARIEELMKEGKSVLAAARQVYEEVKGHDYRNEQAVAKLLELLEIQNKRDLHMGELSKVYKAMEKFVDGLPETDGASENPAANDNKYLVNTP